MLPHWHVNSQHTRMKSKVSKVTPTLHARLCTQLHHVDGMAKVHCKWHGKSTVLQGAQAMTNLVVPHDLLIM
jgi:hypothetical protein